eukprot:gene3508-3964_t
MPPSPGKALHMAVLLFDAPCGLDPCCEAVVFCPAREDCHLELEPRYDSFPETSVVFNTTDAQTQALYSHAEICGQGNWQNFAPGFDVLVEGGHYNAVWLETQPMGGAMWGVRNLSLAINNQLIFMRTQRQDGRSQRARKLPPLQELCTPLTPTQGFYMASPAVDVAWLMNRTSQPNLQVADYLRELKQTLTLFDSWLWEARNSSHGVLWLAGDADTGDNVPSCCHPVPRVVCPHPSGSSAVCTELGSTGAIMPGEDGSDKYRSLPGNPLTPPFENMDMMGYAHDAQGNVTGSSYWSKRMADTAAALKERLWREEHGACFDRERDGEESYVSSLLHNNVRAMWHEIFSQ